MNRLSVLLLIFLTSSTLVYAEDLCSENTATIFFTGNDRGELKPCGCSGGQLGGFERRPAIFNTVSPEKRLVIDTGSLVETDDQQETFKFNIMYEAFSISGYDVINTTSIDAQIAKNLGLSDNANSSFKIITSDQNNRSLFLKKFEKTITLKDHGKIIFNVASIDLENLVPKILKKLFPANKDKNNINILIVTGYGNMSDKIELKNIDCLITPPVSDEPAQKTADNHHPLIITGGRFGKYVGRIDIIWSNKDKKPVFKFSSVPLTEDTKQTASLIELYKVYQQLVAEAGLLEKHPKFKLESDLMYLGSDSCKSCHEYEYEKWSQKRHADAYATLERVGSQYDPQCIGCHVIGFDYDTGYVTEEQTPYLKDVGCENCHGPGSLHVISEGQEKTTTPQIACNDCHTPEHSTHYAGNEEEYFEKIKHWQEQKPAKDVKTNNKAEK